WTPDEQEAADARAVAAITEAAEAESRREPEAEALWQREQSILDAMQRIAEQSRHAPDAKAHRLVDWIRANLCPGLPPFGQSLTGAPPKWNDRRVLIFTENREGTKRWLKQILEQAIACSESADERIAVIDGLV